MIRQLAAGPPLWQHKWVPVMMAIASISTVGGLCLLLSGASATAAIAEMAALSAFGGGFVGLALAILRFTRPPLPPLPRARLRNTSDCQRTGAVKCGSSSASLL